MLHTIHDEIYDANKEARGGIDVDNGMKRIYKQNEQDILIMNHLMLDYVKANATKEEPINTYIFKSNFIESLNVIKAIEYSYQNMNREQKARTARLLMADILQYYERLHLYGHFDEEKFEIQFDLPY